MSVGSFFAFLEGMTCSQIDACHSSSGPAVYLCAGNQVRQKKTKKKKRRHKDQKKTKEKGVINPFAINIPIKKISCSPGIVERLCNKGIWIESCFNDDGRKAGDCSKAKNDG